MFEACSLLTLWAEANGWNEWLHVSFFCLIELDDQVYCLIWNLINTVCLPKRYFVCLTGTDIRSLKKKRKKEKEREKKKNDKDMVHMKGKYVL